MAIFPTFIELVLSASLFGLNMALFIGLVFNSEFVGFLLASVSFGLKPPDICYLFDVCQWCSGGS